MSGPIEKRLTELRAEFEKGQNLLTDLEVRREHLKESLLRIAGAVQVLEELMGEGSECKGDQCEGGSGSEAEGGGGEVRTDG